METPALAPAAYIVAATPRTGSSLLCEGLAATGIAGFPDEIFAPHLRALWLHQWSLADTVSFRDYLAAALRYSRSGNGVTAFKIHWMHVTDLAKDAGCLSRDVLSRLLPEAQFINTIRRDRRAQALSLFRANETDEWSRFADSADPPLAAPPLNLAAVRACEAEIELQQASWLEYFARRNLVPLTIEYEALEEDHRREVARVLAFLGLDSSAADAIPPPRRTRQADHVTAGWRRQLDLADRGL